MTAQPDPEPALTQRIVETLAGIARGEEPTLMLPALRTFVFPAARQLFADRLRTQQSFTFLACDSLPAGALSRRGDLAARRCYYKAVNATETRYYTIWLTSDGRIADLASALD